MVLGLWDKKLSTETRDLPLKCLKILIPDFSETIKVPREKTQYFETKGNVTKSSWSNNPKTFWYHNNSETHKGSPTNISATVRQKIFIWKSWYTPNMLKSFRYPKLVKH